MPSKSKTPARGRAGRTAAAVRDRVMRGGERLWRREDFPDLPPQAVSQALSRLARQDKLRRVHKGTYYRPHPSTLGESRAAQSDMLSRLLRAPVHPAGLTAANALGLSTQNPARPQFAAPTTRPGSRPREWTMTVGRPPSRRRLSADEAAVLELLRDHAMTSDLSPEETAERIKRLLADDDAFAHLARVALDEPPRVRAMLGAIGQELGMPAPLLGPLRTSLNPLSRFDFGKLRGLRFAKEWQAK